MPFGRVWNGSNGNYDLSRLPITTIVLHSTAGSKEGVSAWFNNPASKVSAHYMITKSGEIYAFSPETVTAYHSGVYKINGSSIGIEFEDGGNNQAPRTPEQLRAGAELIADICRAYSITPNRISIKAHREIKNTACPGNLPIDSMIEQARIKLLPPVSNEPLHTYQMPESVFVGMVTKGTNLDNLLVELALDPKLGLKPDSYKDILAYIQIFINREVEKGIISSINSVPKGVSLEDGLSTQEKNILFRDVPNIWEKIKGLFSRNGGQR